MDLSEVPLDAPIPTGETLYVWYEAEGYWTNWIDWVFRAARREPGRTDQAAAEQRRDTPRAAQSPLFK